MEHFLQIILSWRCAGRWGDGSDGGIDEVHVGEEAMVCGVRGEGSSNDGSPGDGDLGRIVEGEGGDLEGAGGILGRGESSWSDTASLSFSYSA